MAEAATVAVNAPGWFDLASPDPESSRRFYTELFGWTADVSDDPQYGGYGMFKLDGKEVGGIGPQQNPQQPPAWTIYVIVSDANAIAQSAKDAGGVVFVEPMEVPEQGVMAVIADPSGAAFGIWEPKAHGGVEVRDVPGAFSWVELATRNRSAAVDFYRSVFGWEAEKSKVSGPVDYTEFKLEGTRVAGAMDVPSEVPGQMPSYWMVYWQVDDPDAVVARAKELGGGTLAEPQDIEPGRFAVIRDPHGAVFGVIKPKG